MRSRNFVMTLGLLALAAAPLRAQQTITNELIDRFLAGRAAERPELDKVGAEIKELDKKIKNFRECFQQLREAGQIVGTRAAGFAAKALTRARCGATDEDGMIEDREKLLEKPEQVGASAAGMSRDEYSQMKERITGYLGGNRNFAEGELKVLAARAADLSNGMGLALVKLDDGGGRRGGGGSGLGGMISGAIGGAVASQMRMFTPDMTWAYVSYLNGMLYLSGATMFESDYKSGEWTRWKLEDASQPDQHTILERAMIRRDTSKAELWRTKTIVVGPERADTIIMEQLMRPIDREGTTMKVVRMRGKFPGDSAGKEMMVPENMTTLAPSAWQQKPTKESIEGATIGTESITVAGKTYSAKHVQFGQGGGTMDWWLSDKAPGGLVKVQNTVNGQDGKWTMELTGSGTGAKSELGFK